jgi:hypothetical protein
LNCSDAGEVICKVAACIEVEAPWAELGTGYARSPRRDLDAAVAWLMSDGHGLSIMLTGFFSSFLFALFTLSVLQQLHY